MSELSCEYLTKLCTSNVCTFICKEIRDKVPFDTEFVRIIPQLKLSMWLLSDVLTR